MRNNSLPKSLLCGLVLCLLLAGLSASRLVAQVVKGSISGSLVDQSGAAVPGADVRATNKDTGLVSSAASETSGLFRLALLPVGTYSVEISKSGFRKLVLSDVEVSAARDSGLGTLALEVGQPTTIVEVSEAPTMLETSQVQVSTSIKGSEIATFSGVGEAQGLDNLALYLPGVNSVRDNAFSNSNGGVGFSVNGLRGRSNDQQMDGQNNNDNSVAGPYIFLGTPDFVEEYQITTNNFGPEYGRNSGSVVNIITKSGTNGWHGTVFGTESNSALNSLSNTQKAFENLHKVPQFNDEFTGGTIGGPIKRDRVFVFGGFDNERISQKAVYSTGQLTPTPSGLNQLGSCSFANSASVAALKQFGPYGVTGGSPTPQGTPSPVTLSDPSGSGASCSVEMAGVQRTLSTPTHVYDALARLDVNGTKDRVYGRFIYQKVGLFNADPFGIAAPGYPANVPSFGEDFGLSWTRNISSRTVNETRVSYGRLTVEFGGNTIGNTIPDQSKVDTALTRVSMADPTFLGFGPATNSPQGRIVNTYQVQDNLSSLRGKHQIKAGVNYTYQRSPNIFLPNFNGRFLFSDYGALIANAPTTVRVALGSPTLDFRERDLFLYVGDDYQVKPNLTLNLGLTYSYFGQPANLFHNSDVKRESNPSTAFFNPSLPLSVRTFAELPSPKDQWGPSVGFAYTPRWGGGLTGAGKTVIRGGYRLTYDPPFYNIYLNIASSAPQVFLDTLTGSEALANPLPASPLGPAVRSELAPSLTTGVFDPRHFNQTTVSPDFRADRVHTWSFGIQREFTPRAILEARYAGNRGGRLFQSIDGNPLVSGFTSFPNAIPAGISPCPASQAADSRAIGREHCDQGVVLERANTARSDYQGLQLEFRATNLANQLTLRSAYTWSKTTDNVSEIFATGAAANTNSLAQNPFDFIHSEHGLSGLDFPQNWTLSFYEEIPAFRNQRGIKGQVLGGWGISGAYIISSGQPYTPAQTFINLNTGGTFTDTRLTGGTEVLRPFLSNPNAAVGSVGIFAADACGNALDGCLKTNPANPNGPSIPTALGVLAATNPSALIDWTALNPNSSNTDVFRTTTASAVRFIANGLEADTIFGTPFGSAGRNTLRDYHSNVANFTLFKNFKFSERVRLQFHMTMVNVFNHPNFSSIDPYIDDAGFASEFTGFANPRLFSGSTLANFSQGTTPGAGQRAIKFGLRLVF